MWSTLCSVKAASRATSDVSACFGSGVIACTIHGDIVVTGPSSCSYNQVSPSVAVRRVHADAVLDQELHDIQRVVSFVVSRKNCFVEDPSDHS